MEDISFVPKVKWLRLPPSKFDFLTFEEADRLVAAADAEWRTMIVVALETGLRQGELLALTWDDIDLVAGRLVVSRNACPRRDHDAEERQDTRELSWGRRAWHAEAPSSLRGDVVFCKEDGGMFTEGSEHLRWRACKRAGLCRIGRHVHRHTFASHLFMRNAPTKAVQDLTGHSTVKMTERYAHLSRDVRKDAVHLLDRAIPQGHAHMAHTSGGAQGPAMPEESLIQALLLPEPSFVAFRRIPDTRGVEVVARKVPKVEYFPRCASPTTTGYDRRRGKYNDEPFRSLRGQVAAHGRS